ncbi:MAG: cytochrome c-type biogenesis protein CcmH [Alphaproteobacteria bacterium]|nr:cytochrome c-type biogenesis protein CcmH [Alphaproteobacteria bacterium]MBU1563336.1 cytochrome c-type biogenesis protein CcmH [Alphaproteobacteria bacterium]MBU2302059.1 cytochrome c-type biogenesis protein CcmH [Alphaproteobacteria bacterium]MBU2367315.1 cytochrome c-type biogenesis protein CcmH [Alphaproteobacteria bacterium]
MTWLRALLIALLLAAPVAALSPEEILPDPVLEQRARDISAGLRCLVCQNQSIDDSDADLAKDLRVLVRERLVAGDSDEAVRQFLVDRYGEYVLLNPRVGGHTILLWVAAPVLLFAGLGTLFVVGRKRRTVESGLSAEEQAALDELK